jgi:hypothetical protein
MEWLGLTSWVRVIAIYGYIEFSRVARATSRED